MQSMKRKVVVESTAKSRTHTVATSSATATASSIAPLFAGWKACPVIRISVSTLSGYDEAVVEHVVRQVRAYVAWDNGAVEGMREVCSTDARSDNDR